MKLNFIDENRLVYMLACLFTLSDTSRCSKLCHKKIIFENLDLGLHCSSLFLYCVILLKYSLFLYFWEKPGLFCGVPSGAILFAYVP